MTEIKQSGARDYLFASLVGFVLTAGLGAFLLARRGFMFDAPLTAGMFYVPNQVLAGVAALMIGLSFLVGPVSRYSNRFDRWLNYRKEIGIVGGLLGFLHGIVSMFLVPTKFSVTSLFSEYAWPSTVAGLVAAGVLMFLIFISAQTLIQKLGGARWWFLQRWGIRLSVAAILYHVIAMKWTGWERWFRLGVPETSELANPWMVPSGILVTLFLVWVTVLRVYESMFLFRSLGISTHEIAGDPILLARGRRFFWGSFSLLVIAYALVLTRWVLW